jgi:eukaryotic-like serine/threonine-protein kinase
MEHILNKGQEVLTSSSHMKCVVEDFLGGGGQGEVYRANVGGKPVALKWYFPESASVQQRQILNVLIDKGPPNDRFLWPTELTDGAGVEGFGYLMPLREPRYHSIVDLMRRRIDPSFRALTTAGLHLAHSYLLLHAKGLCYRDISFGNVFFDPQNGDVLICDNDNVSVHGAEDTGVLGTPRFMAPEVVCGRALPSTHTDLYSLAVLLFYMLMIHHPLEGKRELEIHSFDLPAMTRLYGEDPVFIFDPSNEANRPDPKFHRNAILLWSVYPKFLQRLFMRAFTDGLRDPLGGRVRESQWRSAMVQLRDSIIYCSNCGSENFYDAEAKQTGAGVSCWNCNREIALPYRIRVGNRVVMLNRDTQLFPHHLDQHREYDFSKALAAVSRHPTDAAVWGLKNLSAAQWISTNREGGISSVEPGRTVRLDDGVTIQFGNSEGEIRI